MNDNYNNLLNDTIRNIEIIYNDLLLLRNQNQSQNYRRRNRNRRRRISQQQYYPSQQQQYPSQQQYYPSQQQQYPSQQQQYYTPQYYYYPQQNTIRYPLSQPLTSVQPIIPIQTPIQTPVQTPIQTPVQTPIQTQIGEGNSNYRYTSDSSNVLLFTYFDTFPSTTPLRRNNIRMDNTLQRFYENVPISATQNEISQSTTTSLYNGIITPLNTSCPITLETFNDNDMVTQIIGCGHVFDPSGINIWFQSNVRCPVCRYDIRTNSTSSNNNEQSINNTNGRTSTRNNDLLTQYAERLMRELYPDF
jgi:Ring finger domain